MHSVLEDPTNKKVRLLHISVYIQSIFSLCSVYVQCKSFETDFLPLLQSKVLRKDFSSEQVIKVITQLSSLSATAATAATAGAAGAAGADRAGAAGGRGGGGGGHGGFNLDAYGVSRVLLEVAGSMRVEPIKGDRRKNEIVLKAYTVPPVVKKRPKKSRKGSTKK